MSDAALIVIAKAPVPGKSKTRLCPPCTPEQAARLAEAALADTLEAVAATAAVRRVLALDGVPGAWLPEGFEVIVQRGDGLDQRLAAAFEDTGGPALLIGMDTPQVTPSLLTHAIDELLSPGTDAVLGPADDGGWWAMGLRVPDGRAVEGVPMSTGHTGRAQLRRLEELGRRVKMLPALRDIDRFTDAVDVAERLPGSMLHATLSEILRSADDGELAWASDRILKSR